MQTAVCVMQNGLSTYSKGWRGEEAGNRESLSKGNKYPVNTRLFSQNLRQVGHYSALRQMSSQMFAIRFDPRRHEKVTFSETRFNL